MYEKGIRWEIRAGGGDQLLEIARPVLSRLWQELDVQEAIVAVEWESDAAITLGVWLPTSQRAP
jgi:hypothetical protein